MLGIRKLRCAMLLPAVCLGLLALSGCGGREATVKGTVVLPPDIQLKDNDGVDIRFQPAESAEGTGGLGVYTPADKTFVVKSADGKGIAPGKYKVSVKITPYGGGTVESQKSSAAIAELNNAYGSGAKLSYDVTGDSTQNIVIDLTNGTITKK